MMVPLFGGGFMRGSRSLFLLSYVALLGAAASCGVGHSTGGDPDSRTGGSAGTTGGSGSGGSAAGGSDSGGTGTGGTIHLGGDGGSSATGGSTMCMPPVGPFCGDMHVDAGEECDDGNPLPGDGCSGTCVVEPNWACPPQGGVCMSTLRCGDGIRSPGEACDDGNVMDGDGCAADCANVDPGYYCPTPGKACLRAEGECGDSKVQPGETCDDGNAMDGDGCTALCRVEPGYRCTQPGTPCLLVPVCGNGKLEGAEECDDGLMASGDGCSSTCRIEPGWLCETPGMPCRKTMCGDGKREGSECCDDGNKVSLDGCTADCLCEPSCPATGACTAKCGNGIVEGTEACDDGNTASGDGCSATCQTEQGYKCTQPACTMVNGGCALVVPVIYRDFNAHGATGGHPDFQPGYDSNGAVQGLVADTLDMDGKPVLSSTASTTNGFMHGQSAFAQWYRDAAPSGGPIPATITLWDNGKGGYVNRWGANGEQWLGDPSILNYGTPTYGGPGGTGCEACTPGAGQMCYDPCVPWGSQQACCADIPASNGYDGNPLFFPIDKASGILTETREAAKVPEQYGWNGWPWETDVAKKLGVTTPVQTSTAPFPSATHNFSFTTEVKYWFKYDAKATATLEFTGDDDVWVFLNGHLAVDLGGWHVPLNGTLTLAPGSIKATTNLDVKMPPTVTTKNGTAATYGLEDGNVYQIKVFHAEREKEGSSFKLTLGGFNMLPSDCEHVCGDGIVTVEEECDLGAQNSDDACGACTTQCKFGPRCGDGVFQADCGEECDDGVNVGGYNQCDVGCKLGPRCGDGKTQDEFGEQCDDGANNGMPGGCTAGCGVPAFCGDGVVTPPEECDNGINDNSYGGCSQDCHYGPRCGDGVVQAEGAEECDFGAMNAADVYGGCTPQCKLGPHCGDGVVQAAEQCDAGGGDGTGAPVPATDGCDANNSSCNDQCRIVAMPPR